MAIWNDIAKWRGPTVNSVKGGMVEWRGLVVHIAEGSYEGTIAWQKNPTASVSSHFVVDVDGMLAQVVDTDDTAWTQIAGNGHWLSIECAGHTPNPLTPAQLETIARLLVKCHQVYGVPLEIASNPNDRGLGHHSMGSNGRSVSTDTWSGPQWGHDDCPGPAIITQKTSIMDIAVRILNGEDDMPKIVRDQDTGAYWVTNGPNRSHLKTMDEVNECAKFWGINVAAIPNVQTTQLNAYGADTAATPASQTHD